LAIGSRGLVGCPEIKGFIYFPFLYVEDWVVFGGLADYQPQLGLLDVYLGEFL
jgi:hypothetical protein